MEWGDQVRSFMVFSVTMFLIAWAFGQACTQAVR